MENENKKIAIITGASAGLGVEYVRQIEERYDLDEIWLVARREAPMRELARAFKKAKGQVLLLDLVNKDDLKNISEKLSAEKPRVALLVNNAGFGKVGAFKDIDLQAQLDMVDLNVRALTELSYVCIPYMKPGAAIIQVASSIAFVPSPSFAVYAATKAYVLSFAQALGYELESAGIRVIAVCPGPVETEFFIVANNGQERNPFSHYVKAKPDKVVKKSLDDLDRKKSISIFGFQILAFSWLSRFMPKRLIMRALSK